MEEELKHEDQSHVYKSACVSKMHESLLVNSFYFLAYCCLQECRFDDVIRYSNILKREFDLSPLVRFNVALYLTEAHISKGNHSEAFNVLRAEITDGKMLPACTYENILTGIPDDI